MNDTVYRFEQICELKYSGSTPKNYASMVRQFLEYTGRTDVDADDVLKYNIYIRKKSYSFRNSALSAIKAYFLLMQGQPLKGIANIRPPKQRKKPVVYDCNELSEKIKAIRNTKHRAILAISLCCWLRKSELLNLKINDINGALKHIHIKQSKGCKDRIVPITESTLKIVRAYYRVHKPKVYLFEGQNGGRYGATSVDKITKKYLYQEMRFHSLRASGATYALANGTDLKTVSEILGHAKIQTTEHYIPTLYQNIKQAI